MSEPALGEASSLMPLTPLTDVSLRSALALSTVATDAGVVALGAPASTRPKPKGANSDDELSAFTPPEVAGWYRRLALMIQAGQADSLAALMLLHWLDGKGAKLTFPSARVEKLSFVVTYLKDKTRTVLLTEKKAQLKDNDKWAGVLPRIKKMPGFPAWDGSSPIPMSYTGPSVSVPLTVHAKAAFGLADPDELDILMSLHTFGLETNVVVTATPVTSTPRFTVAFTSWQTRAFDTYDWDPAKHLTTPNPDFGNPAKLPAPIAPADKTITVYHSNAKRVEKEGLAAPYSAVSLWWTPADPETTKSAIVDSARTL
jgi:hypothetical protein